MTSCQLVQSKSRICAQTTAKYFVCCLYHMVPRIHLTTYFTWFIMCQRQFSMNGTIAHECTQYFLHKLKRNLYMWQVVFSAFLSSYIISCVHYVSQFCTLQQFIYITVKSHIWRHIGVRENLLYTNKRNNVKNVYRYQSPQRKPFCLFGAVKPFLGLILNCVIAEVLSCVIRFGSFSFH